MKAIKYAGVVFFIALAGCESEIPAAVEEAAAAKAGDAVKKLTKDAEELEKQDAQAVADLEKNAEDYNDSGTTGDTTANDGRYSRGTVRDRNEDFGYVEGDSGEAAEQNNFQDEAVE